MYSSTVPKPLGLFKNFFVECHRAPKVCEENLVGFGKMSTASSWNANAQLDPGSETKVQS
jgi:hypothetical protein